jgi:hypothetical protein
VRPRQRYLFTTFLIGLALSVASLSSCAVTQSEPVPTPSTTRASNPFASEFRSLTTDQQMAILRSVASDGYGRAVTDAEITQSGALLAVAIPQLSEICREVSLLSTNIDSAVSSWVSNFRLVASRTGPALGPFSLFVLTNMLTAECPSYIRR